ncbi:MAG: hypothetical protein AABX34_05935 [Nanoarchaeota archaeon]
MVESIRELRKICQTKKQPLYMKLVSMKISIYITKALLYTKISADYVTIAMIILLIAGSVLMSLGSLWAILSGILIIHLTVILDNVNGEVARYRKEDGRIGTFLEQVYHNLAVPFLFFGLAFGVFLKTGLKSVLVFGFLASIFGLPIVLKSIKDAIIDERSAEMRKKLKPKKTGIKGELNIEGGSSDSGKALYKAYSNFRAFWVYPANIVHITILSIVEIINAKYGFAPGHIFFALYIYLYGAASTIIQTAAFIANYKGRTVDHYYQFFFGSK